MRGKIQDLQEPLAPTIKRWFQRLPDVDMYYSQFVPRCAILTPLLLDWLQKSIKEPVPHSSACHSIAFPIYIV